MATVGNTVILKGEFPNEIGDLTLLTSVTVKIYTSDLKLITTIFTVTKISTGIYEALYTVTDKFMPDYLLYEFSGVLGGKTYLGRAQLTRTYI